MAWRIHEHVLRGEIDNRTRGRVTGRVWLAGVAEPLLLDLRGDCYPDLAGCELRFENPVPLPLTTQPPAAQQRGDAGDITAARKVRVFDIPLADALAMYKRGEKPPEHMANSLYLEWYSDLSGRVVIESADYRLEISEATWRFTAEELAARDKTAAESSGVFAIEMHDDGTTEEWDEFRCEQLLRESDLTGEKYRRLIEQYADHPDSESIIAREMGWIGPEEALGAEPAEDDEPLEDAAAELDDFEETPPDPAREGIDWVRDEQGWIVHPLAQRAHDALYALFDELRAAGHGPESYDAPMEDFIGYFSQLCAKLAGALGSLALGAYSPDSGLIVALLKRALEIHNQTLLAADALAGSAMLTAESVAKYRGILFTVREEMLALMARLRG